jgi:hypothetical protein
MIIPSASSRLSRCSAVISPRSAASCSRSTATPTPPGRPLPGCRAREPEARPALRLLQLGHGHDDAGGHRRAQPASAQLPGRHVRRLHGGQARGLGRRAADGATAHDDRFRRRGGVHARGPGRHPQVRQGLLAAPLPHHVGHQSAHPLPALDLAVPPRLRDALHARGDHLPVGGRAAPDAGPGDQPAGAHGPPAGRRGARCLERRHRRPARRAVPLGPALPAAGAQGLVAEGRRTAARQADGGAEGQGEGRGRWWARTR